MEKTPFKCFLELIQKDQSFIAVEKELDGMMTEIDTIQDQLADESLAYEKERGLVQDLRKDVDAQELEMRSLDEKEKISRERSALASTPKEYQSFQKECDRFKLMQHEHEQVLLQAWSTYEQAQKAFEVKEREYKEKKAILEVALDACEAKKQSLLTTLGDYEQARKECLAAIPEEWLEKYNRMRNVVPNPVVTLVGNTCGGCSFMLTQQVVMALDQNKLLQCAGCYRLLYKNFDSAQPVQQVP